MRRFGSLININSSERPKGETPSARDVLVNFESSTKKGPYLVQQPGMPNLTLSRSDKLQDWSHQYDPLGQPTIQTDSEGFG